MSGKQNIFHRFLLSYILVLLVPLLIGWIVYYRNIKTVESQEIEATMKGLEKAANALDTQLREVQELVTFIGEDVDTKRLTVIQTPWQMRDYGFLVEMINRLMDYKKGRPFIQTLYVAYTNDDRVITTESSYPIPLFYEHIFSYPELNQAEWRALFLETYHTGTFLDPTGISLQNGRPTVFITYIQSFSLLASGRPKYIIWATIPEEQIRKILRLSPGQQNVFLIDQEGQVVYSYSHDANVSDISTQHLPTTAGFFKQRIKNKTVVVSYVPLSVAPWALLAVEPVTSLTATARSILTMAVLITIGTILFGLLGAFILARRSYRPYKVLNEQNIYLKLEKRTHLPELQLSFMESLMYGEHREAAKIRDMLAYLDISLPSSSFVVVTVLLNVDAAVQVERIDALFKARLSLKSMLSEEIGFTTYLFNRGEEGIILLCCSDDKKDSFEKALEYRVRDIHRVLTQKHSIRPHFFVGNVYDRIDNIWYSFMESREASESLHPHGNLVVSRFQDRILERRRNLFYPIDLEKNIINNVRAGNWPNVKDLLDRVLQENLHNRELHPEMLRLLLNEMSCTAIRLMNDVVPERGAEQTERADSALETIYSLSKVQDFDVGFSTLADLYLDMCAKIENSKNSHNCKLIEAIKTYIIEQAANWNLSRYMVANEFGLHEDYVSSFFKEQLGVTFSDFLNDTRMKSACQLLKDHSLKVAEIAARVGYTNERAFSRAFKRSNGVNPTAYRSQLQPIR